MYALSSRFPAPGLHVKSEHVGGIFFSVSVPIPAQLQHFNTSFRVHVNVTTSVVVGSGVWRVGLSSVFTHAMDDYTPESDVQAVAS